jgi:hypothetical protein
MEVTGIFFLAFAFLASHEIAPFKPGILFMNLLRKLDGNVQAKKFSQVLRHLPQLC